MEEIQELLRNCRKIDFPVPRNAASIAYIARDSPSLSLCLQMQKFLSDELIHCCEVLLNDKKITGLFSKKLSITFAVSTNAEIPV